MAVGCRHYLALVVLATIVMAGQTRPWEQLTPPGPLRDALAIRNYIDWAVSRPEVAAVSVHIDSVFVFDEPFALVTVSVFTAPGDSVNLSMMASFEFLSDSSVMIFDTTYLKESRE